MSTSFSPSAPAVPAPARRRHFLLSMRLFQPLIETLCTTNDVLSKSLEAVGQRLFVTALLAILVTRLGTLSAGNTAAFSITQEAP